MTSHSPAARETRHTELAAFLRAQRARLIPADVGLPDGSASGRRRTPGLRREEVAQLSGVSVTWYTWLEQARNISASPQVIDALARALLLTTDQHRHLRELAGLPAPQPPRPGQDMLPRLQRLVDAVAPSPASIYDSHFDYLAWNESYARLRHDPSALPDGRRNMIWMMFTDPGNRARMTRWEAAARAVLSQFRIAAGQHPGDPRFTELASALTKASPEFRNWWADYPVRYFKPAIITVNHPQAGPVQLEMFQLPLAEHPGLLMVIQLPASSEDRTRITSLLPEHGSRPSITAALRDTWLPWYACVMSVDDDLAAWIAGLDDLFALVAGRFFRVEPRLQARAYVRGLLAPLASKNGWTLAEAAGDATPDGMQRLLNRAAWDADGVRDDVRAYVAGHLGSADGVLVVDETGFLKKGGRSAGVQRQYSGTAGRVENCQLGVFCAYVTRRGRALIDRELYLPKSWIADRERCRQAAVPDDVEFATKAELARQMLARAIDAGVPAAWVTADEAYGQDHKFRSWLEQRRIGYVVAVPCSQAIPGSAGTSRADVLAAQAPEQAWKRRSCGAGAKGPRIFDWAVASLPACPDTTPPGWSRWLLVRRALTRNAKGELELAYYLCCAPAGTTDEDLIRVAGFRWAVEECFATAKTETGLDQYQVRRYDAWYRHITLAMLAHAYLSVTAAIAPKALAAASSRSHSARSAVSWHT